MTQGSIVRPPLSRSFSPPSPATQAVMEAIPLNLDQDGMMLDDPPVSSAIADNPSSTPAPASSTPSRCAPVQDKFTPTPTRLRKEVRPTEKAGPMMLDASRRRAEQPDSLPSSSPMQDDDSSSLFGLQPEHSPSPADRYPVLPAPQNTLNTTMYGMSQPDDSDAFWASFMESKPSGTIYPSLQPEDRSAWPTGANKHGPPMIMYNTKPVVQSQRLPAYDVHGYPSTGFNSPMNSSTEYLPRTGFNSPMNSSTEYLPHTTQPFDGANGTSWDANNGGAHGTGIARPGSGGQSGDAHPPGLNYHAQQNYQPHQGLPALGTSSYLPPPQMNVVPATPLNKGKGKEVVGAVDATSGPSGGDLSPTSGRLMDAAHAALDTAFGTMDQQWTWLP
ncbi:hypothetical protein FIBSPDRAFT_1011483 [Athelia psychrophila]|uniref:Uncharacterized protein n=1 Tax=Athelia psychrophila TaxID=1759441 RepID=A0A166MUU6_9AGAM|nr:hypothetical protein FIBSPDRAFT_1011483 [Fibularhizoctonia sp. CBS 109695]